jgi:hypothetical protein
VEEKGCDFEAFERPWTKTGIPAWLESHLKDAKIYDFEAYEWPWMKTDISFEI